MSFCDELRKIEWENSYSNKKEEIIHREVEGLITGIKVLSRNAARDGKRNLTGYYDQFYWDTTLRKWDTEMFSFVLTRLRRERTKNFLQKKRA